MQEDRTPLNEGWTNKLASELPGISKVNEDQMMKRGVYLASHVLGQYFVLNRDRERFRQWLKGICNGTFVNADECFNFLKRFCAQNGLDRV